MKPCIKCLETKPLSEFYAHSGMRDGHLNKCKVCTRHASDQRQKRLNATDPEWRERELERQREKTKKARSEGKFPNRKASQKSKALYALRNPLKRKARQLVANAIRDGKLQRKPCSECGALNAEAHHHDYSKPLDVIWLCDTHHKAIHREERRISRLSKRP